MIATDKRGSFLDRWGQAGAIILIIMSSVWYLSSELTGMKLKLDHIERRIEVFAPSKEIQLRFKAVEKDIAAGSRRIDNVWEIVNNMRSSLSAP